MKTAIIFDCEFLCLEGSQRRSWCAAHDPDPVIAQIGAVRLGLEGEFPIRWTYKAYVQPIDRFGNRYAIDQFFTKLTGLHKPARFFQFSAFGVRPFGREDNA